jgi:3-methyladenine DNA glycosylase AlkC
VSTRKGYSRRVDIPADLLHRLNRGLEETRTLVEWLAVDLAELLQTACLDVGLHDERDGLVATANDLASEGVMARTIGMSNAIGRAVRERSDGEHVTHALAAHTSDVVRAWACYMPLGDASLTFADRLGLARPFASDPNQNVREGAWGALRPTILNDPPLAIAALEPWVADADANIRRCAVEATRPCGVWTRHIRLLKREPDVASHLLEPVRSDPSRYVQTAVANWLNDASKTCPEWVTDLTDRWLRESDTPETAWTVNHARRTLRKRGLA